MGILPVKLVLALVHAKRFLGDELESSLELFISMPRQRYFSTTFDDNKMWWMMDVDEIKRMILGGVRK